MDNPATPDVDMDPPLVDHIAILDGEPDEELPDVEEDDPDADVVEDPDDDVPAGDDQPGADPPVFDPLEG